MTTQMLVESMYIAIDFVRGSGYNFMCVYVYSQGWIQQKTTRFSMKYLSISQTAEKWGISSRRIQRLCSEGRIPGAMKIGNYWAVPSSAKKPKDERIKSGKYVKQANDSFCE